MNSLIIKNSFFQNYNNKRNLFISKYIIKKSYFENKFLNIYNNNIYLRTGIIFFGGIFYGVLSNLVKYIFDIYFDKLGIKEFLNKYLSFKK